MPNPDLADAIPEDVPATEEAKTPYKSKRQNDMEALEAGHYKRQVEELGLTDESDSEGGDTDVQLAAQLEDPATAGMIEQTEGRRVRVKVDGVEHEVLLDEVLRSYQKGSAADRRLEEATRLLAEARVAQQAQPPQQELPATPEPGADDLKTAVKGAFEKLYAGESDAAVEQMVALLARKAPPAVEAPNIEQIAVQLQQNTDTRAALAKIETDFPDIMANSDLEMLTYMKVQQKEAEGTPRARAMIDAATEVYSAMGKAPGRPVEAATNQRDQKLARKAGLDTVRTANVAAAQPSEPQEENPSAIIAAMAKRRLGQSMAL